MSFFAAGGAAGTAATPVMIVSWSLSIISACATPSVITVIGRCSS